MKKNSTAKKSSVKKSAARKIAKKASAGKKKRIQSLGKNQRLTVGLDLGDRSRRYCILNEAGEIVSEDSLLTTQAGLNSLFGKMPASRVALGVGTHSPWVSRYVASLGHEAIVANPHKVKLITQSVRKNDRIDARQSGAISADGPAAAVADPAPGGSGASRTWRRYERERS